MVEAKLDVSHFFDVSLDLLCIASVEGYFLQVNPAFENTLGYSIEELTEKPFLDFVHEDDQQSTMEEVAKLSAGEPTIFFENRYLHTNGHYIWLSWRCSPDPETGLLYATARDVTDRKNRELQLEEKNIQLKESERHFRSLADCSPVLLWMSDENKALTHFNQSWLNFTGRSLKEECQQWEDNIHPEDKNSFNYFYHSYFDQRKSFKMEFRLRRLDGAYRWLLNTGVPRYGELGEFLGYIGSCVDISEEKVLQAELLELKQRDASPNGVVILDDYGVIQYVNKIASDYLGKPKELLLGSKFTYPTIESLKTIKIKGEKGSGVGEISTVEIDYRNQPAKLITIVDITDHIQMQQRLTASNRMLEKANQSLEQFAYIASHDLQGPIANLKVLIDIWDQRTGDPEETEGVMKGLKSGVLFLHNSMQGLLGSLKIHKGYQEDPEEIKIAEMYEEIEMGIHDLIKDTRAQIHTDFSAFPVVKYVPIHLKSILMNLVTNAIKYRSPDRDPEIIIQTGVTDDRPWMMVKDNGMGIDMDRFKKDMFKLYKRFHDHVKGNGIGLFNIKSIVDSYNGEIQVESEVDQGTTFKIYF